ncbi:hypothetical protein X798_07369 [Onchocerca flexuosa]|uniref:Uncharacterized protein n=1 Tax=Onchocerca flexuosa TaxID=387005 RepID=A0A238BJK7_9BILA|nr:hypothetical protein X798_07369 [Onchocerca flexuosa]
MCDINDTRKSRRKQCAPSRHSNIGRATVISISDESNNAIINNEMMNNNGATVMNEDRISDRDGIDSAVEILGFFTPVIVDPWIKYIITFPKNKPNSMHSSYVTMNILNVVRLIDNKVQRDMIHCLMTG